MYALHGFQGFSKAFTNLIQWLTFYFLLWNYLKMLTGTLLRISFSVIGRCSLVPTSHWLQGKYAGINVSQASFMIIQNHRRLPISIFSVKVAALWSLKRVTGRIFKIGKQFRRSKLILWVQFFHQLRNKKIVKLPSHVGKYLFKIINLKIFISWQIL